MSKLTFDDVLKILNIRLSDEQLSAATALGSAVVTAGAGSGKTTVLSLRFMNLLLEGIAADRILTLTFTNKAASEMYSRIYHHLSLLAKESEEMERELKDSFPNAVISTMDSFWSEIARSGAISHGVSRDFSILDDIALERMVSIALDEMEESGDEDAIYLFSSNKRDQIASWFSTIAKRVCLFDELNEEAGFDAFNEFIELYKESYKPVENIASFFDEIDGYIKKGYALGKKGFINNGDLERSREAFENRDYFGLVRFSIQGKAFEAKELNDEVKERVKAYREDVARLQSLTLMESSAEVERRYIHVFSLFSSLIAKKKREQKLLSFTDVMALARETLLDPNHPEIREYYKRRFSRIMIDEFQDNNGEQRDLLYLLAEREELHSSTIPRADELDSTKLFFVGDAKQSIYRFRGSDVSIFNDLANEISAMGGEYLALTRNYRSHKELVNHFNTIFSEVFPYPSPELDSEEPVERLVSTFTSTTGSSYEAEGGISEGIQEYGGLAKPRIEFVELKHPCRRDKEKDDNDDTPNLQKEAEYIASKISSIIASGESSGFAIPYRENGIWRTRAPHYDDIAILYPTKGFQMEVEKALRRWSIPYTVSESNSALLDGVAYDLYALLQTVVYSDDRAAFIALLASPFARIPYEEILSLIDAMGDAFKAFKETSFTFKNEAEQQSYDNLSALYFKLSSMAGRVPLTELLESAYYESGYYTYIVSSPALAVYGEHFEYVWQLAQSYDSCGYGITDFLDELRSLLGHAGTVENANVLPLGEKGVQLMTIHRSKGLEFKIVFVAGTASGDSKSPNKLLFASHNDQALAFIDVEKDSDVVGSFEGYSKLNQAAKDTIRSPLFSVFSEYEQRRLDAEKDRRLYVALTRAENHLVFVGSPSYTKEELTSKGELKTPSEISGDSLFKRYSNAFEALALPNMESIDGEALVVESPKSHARFNFDWYESAESARESSYKEHRVGVTKVIGDESDNSGPELPSFGEADLINQAKATYSFFGTLVHAALESSIKNDEKESFSAPLSLSSKELTVLEAKSDEIASAFISSPFYKRFMEKRAVECEVRFYSYDDERDVALEGSADAIVDNGDSYLIVDYKTDKRFSPINHKEQLMIYIRAFERIYKKPCYGALCYLRDFSAGPIWDRDGNEVTLEP